jgi:hypothetical protein
VSDAHLWTDIYLNPFLQTHISIRLWRKTPTTNTMKRKHNTTMNVVIKRPYKSCSQSIRSSPSYLKHTHVQKPFLANTYVYEVAEKTPQQTPWRRNTTSTISTAKKGHTRIAHTMSDHHLDMLNTHCTETHFLVNEKISSCMIRSVREQENVPKELRRVEATKEYVAHQYNDVLHMLMTSISSCLQLLLCINNPANNSFDHWHSCNSTNLSSNRMRQQRTLTKTFTT